MKTNTRKNETYQK